MTRRLATVSKPQAADNQSLLTPLQSGRTRAGEVMDRIAGEIRAGRLPPGARLPTEQALMAAMGVSRTVVREAVAALRANGLVTTRQGSGAFVASDESRVPFRIDPDGLSSIEDVLEVMELRLAIEVEAAALAAERRTQVRLAGMERALRSIDTAIHSGNSAVMEDFAFHKAIAAAARNARFAELLIYLGRHVIPRQSIRVSLATPREQRRYLLKIQDEHRRIYEAIAAGSATRARKAMRAHLTGGLNRYRSLAARHKRRA